MSQRSAAEIRRELDDLTQREDETLKLITSRSIGHYARQVFSGKLACLRAELAEAERREAGNG